MYLVNIDSKKEFKIQTKSNQVFVDDKISNLDFLKTGNNKYRIFSKNKVYTVEVLELNKADKKLKLKINGKITEIQLRTNLDCLLKKLGMDKGAGKSIKELKAPMPGLILQMNITEGQEIKKGDPILILEAMKMENVIKARGDATVRSILVKEKQSVEKNQVLIRF